MNKNPNPQGKGLVPVMNNVSSSRTKVDIPPKKIDQISGELFTSIFVLASEFSFKPVVGNTYFLYRREKNFRLSLIGPEQWPGDMFGQYIGRCVLENDLTWTLEMEGKAAQDEDLHRLIEIKKKAFEEALENAEKLEDVLPVYIESLPYYQRLFASALANSLGISMKLSGISELTYSEAKGLLDEG